MSEDSKEIEKKLADLDLPKDFLESGDKYCVLYTDDANPISNHVYEKIGYKRKCDWKEIEFVK